jgi:hypothetical protein
MCIVQPAYFLHYDLDLRSKDAFPEIDEDKVLLIDIELHELNTVTDLYKDGNTYHKTLEHGNTGNTASPFNDCKVRVNVKLEVDDEVIFDNFDGEPILYDLEEYQCPAVFRRTVKICKLNEIIEIKTTNRMKSLDHLPDRHGVF